MTDRPTIDGAPDPPGPTTPPDAHGSPYASWSALSSWPALVGLRSLVRAGLLLADTRTTIDTPERLAARERSIARARTEGSMAIADEMLSGILGRTTHARRPEVVARVRRLIELQPPETIAAGLQAIMSRPDSAAVLPSITVPTTIVVGDEDVITPPSDAAFMHGRISGSTLVVIPGAGHMANLEAPDAFNAALNGLLERYVEQRPL